MTDMPPRISFLRAEEEGLFAGCPILFTLDAGRERLLRRVGIFAMSDMPPRISFVRAILP